MKLEAAKRLLASSKYVKQDRILQIGFGGVGQTMLPILLRHVECNDITVIEADDNQSLFESKYGDTGVKYLIHKVTRQNLHETLERHLSAGDLLVNLSLDIDGIEIVEWCLQNDVLYIDTSIERWPDEPDETIPNLADRTLYHTHRE